MRIRCPHCGWRYVQEFTVLGAAILDRPDAGAPDAAHRFLEYVYVRDNPAGSHRELFYHAGGCRSWLIVSRNTFTHEIDDVTFARDAARQSTAPEAP